MSQNIVLNGVTYVIPDVGDDQWGQNLTDYFVGIPSAVLQKSGGAFTLTADVNFGATFGLLAAYFSSRTSNKATAGLFRLANTENVTWRNAAHDGNLALSVNASDQLTFNGVVISGSTALTASRAVVTNGSGVLTAATTTSTEIGYVNGVTSAIQTQIDLKAPLASPTFTGTVTTPNLILSGLTATTVPYLDGSKQFASSVVTPTELGYVSGVTSAIQTQLNAKQVSGNYITALTGDVAASGPGSAAATIQAGVIVNSMVNVSAAIAYSKLALTGAILNADLAGSIAASKLIGSDIATVGTITSGTWSATTIALNKGGTGQTTKAAAFDALQPMTTGGDIIYGGASGTGTRLANGSAGQVLTSSGTTAAPTWATPTAATVYAATAYHDPTCSWARTNTAFGDPTADATCGFSQDLNTNLALTSYLSGSDKLPGVVFTAPVTGLYEVTACLVATGATSGAYYTMRMTDGVTASGQCTWQQDVNGNFTNGTVVGIFAGTATSVLTVRLQTASSSGALTLGNAAANAVMPQSIYWTVKKIN